MTDLIRYTTEDGRSQIKLRAKDQTVWLTQRETAQQFDVSTDNVGRHLKNIFADRELDAVSVTEESSVIATYGKNYLTKRYNLDAARGAGNSARDTKSSAHAPIWGVRRAFSVGVDSFHDKRRALSSACGPGSSAREPIWGVRRPKSSARECVSVARAPFQGLSHSQLSARMRARRWPEALSASQSISVTWAERMARWCRSARGRCGLGGWRDTGAWER
ncbi:MAG: hypothetical protein I8H76_08630 [Burkholderiales bacterium]|nr:hypothetical protein [Burkholderiales bacterium]MBH2016347.1 hypothetical protein [Burkholderiales bacterium]